VGLEERGFVIEEEEFNASFDGALQELQQTGATEKAEGKAKANPVYANVAARADKSQFRGYETTRVDDARIVALINGDEVTVLNEGDEALLPAPGYPIYPAIMAKLGAVARYYSLNERNNWQPSIDEIASLINERTRAIVVINPNNPTGSITSDETTAQILALAAEHTLVVISDEVYRELCFATPPTSASVLTSSAGAPVITLESLSKTHLIPGWRAGWMVGPAQLVLHAEAMAQCMLFGLPGFVQEAAVTALSVAEEAESRIREYCAVRRDVLLAELEGIPRIKCFVPDAGMFLLLDVRDTGLSGYDFMCELYKTERVSVLDGGAFGRQTSGFVRVCFAADQALLREAAVRIRRFVATRLR
jgi:arginine:pyruvate transaminase